MYKVLLADDNALSRKAVRQSVSWKSNGCKVIGEAENGRKACEMIEKLRPDIVLMDIRMPGMTGLEVIREIRKRDLPVVFIIISSYNNFSYARDALRLDVEDYLLKPFLPADLYAAVYKAAEHIKGLKQLPDELFPPAREMKSVPRWDRIRPLISYPFQQEKILCRD